MIRQTGLCTAHGSYAMRAVPHGVNAPFAGTLHTDAVKSTAPRFGWTNLCA